VAYRLRMVIIASCSTWKMTLSSFAESEIAKTCMTKILEREIDQTVQKKDSNFPKFVRKLKIFWIIWTFWKREQRTRASHVSRRIR